MRTHTNTCPPLIEQYYTCRKKPTFKGNTLFLSVCLSPIEDKLLGTATFQWQWHFIGQTHLEPHVRVCMWSEQDLLPVLWNHSNCQCGGVSVFWWWAIEAVSSFWYEHKATRIFPNISLIYGTWFGWRRTTTFLKCKHFPLFLRFPYHEMAVRWWTSAFTP